MRWIHREVKDLNILEYNILTSIDVQHLTDSYNDCVTFHKMVHSLAFSYLKFKI